MSDDEKPKIKFERPWLRLEGEPVSPGEAPKPLPCQLGEKRACCQGRGYALSPNAATTRAALCECIRSCPACLGRARQTEGNDSRPCANPPPNVVVNLLNAAAIPARYAEARVDAFTNFEGNGRQIVDQLRRWRASFEPKGSQGFVLEGPVGVGKTYLLAAVAKNLAEAGVSVRFTDFFQLLGDLKAGFSEGKGDSTQLAPLIDVDVLIIDELGKGRNNDFELTVLDQLISGRYNRSKPIIASTNYRMRPVHNVPLDSQPAPREMSSGEFTGLEQRIGPRIFSRLQEMAFSLRLEGPDFRGRRQ